MQATIKKQYIHLVGDSGMVHNIFSSRKGIRVVTRNPIRGIKTVARKINANVYSDRVVSYCLDQESAMKIIQKYEKFAA